MIKPNYGFDVDQHTVFLAVTGSHSYGMARPESDVDIRGATLPPRHVRESFWRKFEQFERAKQQGEWGPNSVQALDAMKAHATAGSCFEKCGEIDLVIYDLHKLINLAAKNNPNVLELLFLDEQDVIFTTPQWEQIREQRNIFLSQECRARYNGYAMSQLKHIKGHREWLLNPPKKEPARADFGLPESSVLPADVRNLIEENITKTIRDWGVEDGLDMYIEGAAQDVLRMRMRDFWAATFGIPAKHDDVLDEAMYEAAIAHLSLSKEVIAALKAEKKYRAARKQWQQYQTWKTERNAARAELEAKHGYDTKHASHLIRLLRTGLEIMRDGELRVRRPDAEELMAIRNGIWTYEELMEKAEGLQVEMKEAAKTTALPQRPDFEALDKLLLSVLG
jgi:predicted nucleotidyltransferase